MFKRFASFIGVLFFAAHLHAAKKIDDHKMWEDLLKVNVDTHGFVNYQGVRTNKGGDLYQFLSAIEVENLSAFSEEEKLAFWINAYNAHVVKYILANPALKKLMKIRPCSI